MSPKTIYTWYLKSLVSPYTYSSSTSTYFVLSFMYTSNLMFCCSPWTFFGTQSSRIEVINTKLRKSSHFDHYKTCIVVYLRPQWRIDNCCLHFYRTFVTESRLHPLETTWTLVRLDFPRTKR